MRSATVYNEPVPFLILFLKIEEAGKTGHMNGKRIEYRTEKEELWQVKK
jgi:hypothetical protein